MEKDIPKMLQDKMNGCSLSDDADYMDYLEPDMESR